MSCSEPDGDCVAMPEPEASRLDLTQVLERFPDRAALIGRLLGESDAFRGLCEDFALARSTLARLLSVAEHERNVPVISDYESVVAELESDIATALRRADAAG